MNKIEFAKEVIGFLNRYSNEELIENYEDMKEIIIKVLDSESAYAELGIR